MKLERAAFDDFCKKPDSLRGCLLYGKNDGLIAQTKQQIISYFQKKGLDEYSIKHLSYEKIEEDNALLDEAMTGSSLFGSSEKLVIINDAEKGLVDLLKTINEKIFNDCFLLIIAGEIKKDSPLSKYAEASKIIGCAPLYIEEDEKLTRIILEYIKNEGKEISRDAIRLFLASVHHDRMVIMSELEKLVIYCGERTKIEYTDIEAVVASSTDKGFEDLIMEIFLAQDYAKMNKQLSLMLSGGESEVAIIRIMQIFVGKIKGLRDMVNSGISIDIAIKQFRPAIFYKYANGYKAIVRKVSNEKIMDIDAVMLNAEKIMKSGEMNMRLVLERTIFKIFHLMR